MNKEQKFSCVIEIYKTEPNGNARKTHVMRQNFLQLTNKQTEQSSENKE